MSAEVLVLLRAWNKCDPILLAGTRQVYQNVCQFAALSVYHINDCACIVHFSKKKTSPLLKTIYPLLQGQPVLVIFGLAIQQKQEQDQLIYTLGSPGEIPNAIVLTRENMYSLFGPHVQWNQLVPPSLTPTMVPSDFDIDAFFPLTCSGSACENQAYLFTFDCSRCDASFCSEACRDTCECYLS
jgi:hypothetical protein